MVKLLIAKGANVNARTSGGATPLFFCNSEEIAKVLLAHNANINARDKEGWTALDMNVYEGQGHEHMIDFLRRRGGREYVTKPENSFSQQGNWFRNTMLPIFRRFLHI
jgi:ankyrin repeat protein